MDLALITLQQVSILFILILVGFICGKTGVVTAEGKKVRVCEKNSVNTNLL